jgi:hypothetical protein
MVSSELLLIILVFLKYNAFFMGEECIQGFGGKARRKETTRKN